MKIVAISDTHSYHRSVKVPDGDTLICSGDITFRGELPIIGDFSNWLKELPHKNKVIVFGNHELGLRSGPNRLDAIEMITDAGAYYLEDSKIEIDGLNFWGSPWQPAYFDWEWNLPRHSPELKDVWDLIPENTNILITHCPPNGILDSVKETWRGPQGCELLEKRLHHLSNLKAHIFGHLHRDGGKVKEQLGVKFVNAAICTDSYLPINSPQVIDI
jgi:Icc-related predicted phosphoesterase